MAGDPVDLAARAARSASQGHDPRLLWPGLDVAAFQVAVDRIVAITSAVVAGAGPVEITAAPGHAETYGRAAFRLGVGALLGYWIERGAVKADAALSHVFATHLDHGRRRHAKLAAEAARLTSLLREAGIESVLLKGLDSARYYPERGARTFQDIDLYVAKSDAQRAGALLEAQGLRAGHLVPGRRQDWATPDRLHSLDLAHADNPWGVDVHWSLARLYHRALTGELPDPELRRCPTVTIAPGSEVRVLPPELRLAFLALHASSALRLSQLAHLLDILFVARSAEVTPHTWSAMLELLARSGSARFAYPPLVLARRLSGGSDAVPAATLAELERRVTGRLRRAAQHLPLTGLAPADRWKARYVLMWAETPRDWLLVLYRVVKPGRFRTLRQYASLARRLWRRLLRDDISYGIGS